MGKILNFSNKKIEEMTDWSTIQMVSSKKAVINIFGYIGIPESWQHDPDFSEKVTTTKEKMNSELERISNLKASEVDVNIDSFGGSANHGLAIYNGLKSLGATITVNYTGWSASIATVIAAAGDTVNAPSNFFGLIHEGRGGIVGTKESMKNYSEWLGKVNNVIAEIYSAKGGKSPEDYLELMAIDGGEGKWISANDFKELGLVDNVTEEIRVAASFEDISFKADKFGLNFNNLNMSLFNNKSKKANLIKINDEVSAVYEGELKPGTKLVGITNEVADGTFKVDGQELVIENSIVKSIGESEPEMVAADEVQARIDSAVESITSERDAAIAERDSLQAQVSDLEERNNNLAGLTSKHRPGKKQGVSNGADQADMERQVRADVSEITAEHRKNFEKKRKGE